MDSIISVIRPTDIYTIPTVPAGTYGRITPRSSLAIHHRIDDLVGVIEEDYRARLSNSSVDYYENSTISYYTTKLAQSIRLDHNRWEVGLAELSYSVGIESLKDNIISKDKELTANVMVAQVGRVSFPQ
uniref:dUTPase-like domain-containing protein n=1 Tax=Timema poppense TaxID=170557 RepID=A0A7R9HCY6_TIMPO|nr:unnamed protein product [Timema poppensis]